VTDVAIVTTTINYPKNTFTELARAAHLIVVGDQKTPVETEELVRSLDGTYLRPDQQDGWRCSEVMGWNCIQRRNIGFLEAARQGADIVITVDDDNCPENAPLWLRDHVNGFTHTDELFPLVASPRGGWFNPGSLLSPPIWARGLPYPEDYESTGWEREVPDAEAKVGVNAGLWLGDPDIDAIQRISRAPITKGLRSIDKLKIARGVWSPINSQNTAWVKDLVPLAVVFPFIGRWDDILGGYTAQWSFWKAGYVAQYGVPLVTQERNDHDLYKDLELECEGMRWTRRWIELLEGLPATGDPLTDLDNLANDLWESDTATPWQLKLADFFKAWTHDWSTI
jgi:hypothetical protein